MSEQLPQSPETTPNKEMSPEQLESYLNAENKIERNAEKVVKNGEKAEQEAKIEALEQAISIEKGSAEKKNKEAASPAVKRMGVSSKKQRAANFDKEMTSVRTHLTPTQRGFSKLIHNPTVEKTSEVIGSTIARPNAILAGGIVAFAAVLAVWLLAKHYGYVLSGFETIGAFIVGWVFGILYDFFRVMITGKKS